MPFPRIASGMSYFVVILFLTLSFGMRADAQQPSAKAAEKPAGQVFPSAVPTPAQPATASADDDADSTPRLGAGDLLEISVYNVPELATKSRLGNNGDVYLPLVDYVHLAGLTIEESQALIEKRLSDGGFVKNPHVTLLVDESASQGASLLGEVTRPGCTPSSENLDCWTLFLPQADLPLPPGTALR